MAGAEPVLTPIQIKTSGAGESAIITTTPSSSFSSPQVVITGNDNFAASLGFKLNGAGNYSIWAQMVEMHAIGQDKRGHLTGAIEKPARDAPGYSKWEREDTIVKGWMIKTMEPNLISLFIRLPTAKAVWDSLEKMYYDGSDLSKIYELRCQATNIKQRGRHVDLYYQELKKLDGKLVSVQFVNSEDQLTDMLTHAVTNKVFYDSLDKLGIGDIYAPT